MIKLAKKKTFNEWVDMGDGVKFLIDYPTRGQEKALLNVIIMDKEKADISPSKLEYMRMFIRYTVKDWQGLDEKCKVINNELEKELWEDLTADIEQTMSIWIKIHSELEFDVYDKKK